MYVIIKHFNDEILTEVHPIPNVGNILAVIGGETNNYQMQQVKRMYSRSCRSDR